MTEKRSKKLPLPITAPSASAFRLEAVRCSRGMSLIFSGIICVDAFEETEILLKSHGGRIHIVGKRLGLTVFENNSLEIKGRVEGIGFGYGKN